MSETAEFPQPREEQDTQPQEIKPIPHWRKKLITAGAGIAGIAAIIGGGKALIDYSQNPESVDFSVEYNIDGKISESNRLLLNAWQDWLKVNLAETCLYFFAFPTIGAFLGALIEIVVSKIRRR